MNIIILNNLSSSLRNREVIREKFFFSPCYLVSPDLDIGGLSNLKDKRFITCFPCEWATQASGPARFTRENQKSQGL